VERVKFLAPIAQNGTNVYRTHTDGNTNGSTTNGSMIFYVMYFGR